MRDRRENGAKGLHDHLATRAKTASIAPRNRKRSQPTDFLLSLGAKGRAMALPNDLQGL